MGETVTIIYGSQEEVEEVELKLVADGFKVLTVDSVDDHIDLTILMDEAVESAVVFSGIIPVDKLSNYVAWSVGKVYQLNEVTVRSGTDILTLLTAQDAPQIADGFLWVQAVNPKQLIATAIANVLSFTVSPTNQYLFKELPKQ